MTEPISILIADDHTLFRDGLRALFNSIQDTRVVGEAASGAQAILEAERLQPDVVLMDIQMTSSKDEQGILFSAQINGIEATRQIVRTSPHIGVVIVTMFEDDDSVFAAMRAGARGYVLKGADQGEMLRVIRAVAQGEAFFGAPIAARLVSFFSSPQPRQLFPDLTAREREVLALIAQGYNNAEIARQLVISGKTVRNHVSNIFNKLQVVDRAQAIIRARDAGLGS
jgi:DNA-binding NarL/FixJ family response regulator